MNGYFKNCIYSECGYQLEREINEASNWFNWDPEAHPGVNGTYLTYSILGVWSLDSISYSPPRCIYVHLNRSQARVLLQWIVNVFSFDTIDVWATLALLILEPPFWCHWNLQLFFLCSCLHMALGHLWQRKEKYQRSQPHCPYGLRMKLVPPTFSDCDTVVHYNCNSLVPFS